MLEAVLSIIFEQNKFFLFREIRFIVQSASLCHLKMVLFPPFLLISFVLYVNVLLIVYYISVQALLCTSFTFGR